MAARLTTAELDVMKVLWLHGELKPADIQQHFPREIKNPALRSVLGILVDKGHVLRRMQGKAFFYKAKTRKQSVFRSALRDLVDTYCDGSTEALLMNLIKKEKLSEEDFAELLRIAQEPSATKKPE